MAITLGVDAVVRKRAIALLDVVFRAGPEIDAGQLDQVREAATRCQRYKTYLFVILPLSSSIWPSRNRPECSSNLLSKRRKKFYDIDGRLIESQQIQAGNQFVNLAFIPDTK
jgi:hypothetical protein